MYWYCAIIVGSHTRQSSVTWIERYGIFLWSFSVTRERSMRRQCLRWLDEARSIVILSLPVTCREPETVMHHGVREFKLLHEIITNNTLIRHRQAISKRKHIKCKNRNGVQGVGFWGAGGENSISNSLTYLLKRCVLILVAEQLAQAQWWLVIQPHEVEVREIESGVHC